LVSTWDILEGFYRNEPKLKMMIWKAKWIITLKNTSNSVEKGLLFDG
jgi:hypothetical protein